MNGIVIVNCEVLIISIIIERCLLLIVVESAVSNVPRAAETAFTNGQRPVFINAAKPDQMNQTNKI
jgi:hypothetical protein